MMRRISERTVKTQHSNPHVNGIELAKIIHKCLTQRASPCWPVRYQAGVCPRSRMLNASLIAEPETVSPNWITYRRIGEFGNMISRRTFLKYTGATTLTWYAVSKFGVL